MYRLIMSGYLALVQNGSEQAALAPVLQLLNLFQLLTPLCSSSEKLNDLGPFCIRFMFLFLVPNLPNKQTCEKQSYES